MFWLGLASGDRGLAMRAHRGALERPRPADGEFAELVDSFEGLLDRLLKRFEDRYANVFNRLDELLKVQQPGRGHAGQLRDGFPQNHVTLRYFFGRATPEWLVPLRNAGFFSSPPEPVPHDDRRTLEVALAAGAVPAQGRQRPAQGSAGDRSGDPGDKQHAGQREPGRTGAAVPGRGSRAALAPGHRVARRPLRRPGPCWDRPALPPPGRRRPTRGRPGPDGGAALQASRLARVPGRHGHLVLRGGSPDQRPGGRPGVRAARGVAAGTCVDETVTAQTPASLREARRDTSGWWRPTIEGQPPGTDTDPASALVSALRDAAAEALSAGADLAAVIAEIESTTGRCSAGRRSSCCPSTPATATAPWSARASPTRPRSRTPRLTGSSSSWPGGAARPSAAATANGSSPSSTAAPRPRGGATWNRTERRCPPRERGTGLTVAARQARRDRARAPARAARPIPRPGDRIRCSPRAARRPATSGT